MKKNLKTVIFATLLWVINIKLFLILANWDQISQIFKYSSGLIGFYKDVFSFYLEFVTTIPSITLLLSIIFAITLYIFWYYYFQVYFHKLPAAKTTETSYWGIFAAVFTFLGFGCVACGETLLTSLLFFFVSNGSMFLQHLVGDLSMVLGIAILIFGIYKNYKIYHNKNMCSI
jgi:hypothetical protein